MTTYWLMLLVPMLAGLSPWKAKGALPYVQWLIYGVLLIIIVGLRHEVGGDWLNYIQGYSWLQGLKFSDLWTIENIADDFGFLLVHWLSENYLNGIYATNLICAAIFIAGLLRVCKNMPIPWIALAVAIPYLVVAVAMGYTRQAAAIGFMMWGLIDLINGRPICYYVMVFIGVFFHKTALFMLPIGFLYTNSLRSLTDWLLFVFLFITAIVALMAERLSYLIQHYVVDTEGMESSGALIRVMMNVFAALVFLYFRKRWAERYSDGRLWMIFSIISLVMLPLTFVISTTIDRMALYFLPMQLVIFSRTPLLIASTYNRTIFILSILFFYIATLFVWLNFGGYSTYWLPYRNLLFK